MSYIGRGLETGSMRQLDDISSGFDGSDTTHTMQINSVDVDQSVIGDVNQLILSLGGVIQKPGTDFTVSGSTLTFTTAPAANTSFFCIVIGGGGGFATPGDLTVTEEKFNILDGKSIKFGTDDEVELTHNADKGLILKHTATADDKPVVLTLQTGETDMAANDVIGKIEFQAPDEGTGTDAILVSGAIQAVAEGDHSSSSNATRLEFMTGASEAATSQMTISSGGIVGIGAGVPGDLGVGLHIKSADSGGSVTSTADELVVEGSGDTGIQILSGASSEAGIAFGDSGDSNIGLIGYDHANNRFRFKTNDAVQWYLDSSGNWLPAATDHGIYLGVTTATASNLLDDYEEGTWSPVFTDGTTDFSMASGSDTCWYTKVGRNVTLGGYTLASSKNSASGATVRLKGLPFAVQSVSGNQDYTAGTNGAFISGIVDTGDQALNPIGYYTEKNTSYLQLSTQDTGVGSTSLTPGQVADNFAIIVGITYKTA